MFAYPRMMAHYDGMKSKHIRLLSKIFATPTSGTLVWSEIEALLVSLGCEVEEKAGSAIKIFHGDDLLFLHRPHPQKEAKKYQVREVAAFLTKIGVTP